MKSAVLLFLALTIITGANAQLKPGYEKSTTTSGVKPVTATVDKPEVADKTVIADGLLMRNGIMMIVLSGKMSPITGDTILDNGYKIMKGGMIIKKDGSKLVLSEGQHLDMAGNLTAIKK